MSGIYTLYEVEYENKQKLLNTSIRLGQENIELKTTLKEKENERK